MQELLRKSAMEQFGAIKDKKVSAVELTQASLNRIHSIDEKSLKPIGIRDFYLINSKAEEGKRYYFSTNINDITSFTISSMPATILSNAFFWKTIRLFVFSRPYFTPILALRSPVS